MDTLCNSSIMQCVSTPVHNVLNNFLVLNSFSNLHIGRCWSWNRHTYIGTGALSLGHPREYITTFYDILHTTDSCYLITTPCMNGMFCMFVSVRVSAIALISTSITIYIHNYLWLPKSGNIESIASLRSTTAGASYFQVKSTMRRDG